MSVSTVIAAWPVVTETHRLTVSTVQLAYGSYDTALFDDSDEKSHTGQTIGGFVVDVSSVWSPNRDKAMEVHRALYLAACEAAGGAS